MQMRAGNMLLLGPQVRRSTDPRPDHPAEGSVKPRSPHSARQRRRRSRRPSQRGGDCRAGCRRRSRARRHAGEPRRPAACAWKPEGSGGRIHYGGAAQSEVHSAQLALGNFYQHVGKHEAAEEAFKRALALAPEDIRTNRALAAFYISAGKPQNAERYLRAIAERTNDPASWSDLADYYTQQRRDADAIRILGDLSTNPKYYAGARRRIAVIAHAAGRRSEAHAILSELRQAKSGRR